MCARNSFKYIYINVILLYIDLSPYAFQVRSKYVRYSLAQFASQWKHNVVHTHTHTHACTHARSHTILSWTAFMYRRFVSFYASMYCVHIDR